MRPGLFVLIALLALTGSARADVFVPADPPPAGEECVAGGGDAIAARSHGQLQLSVGGAAFTPLEGVSGCPALAAADDGTLAIVGSGEGPTRIVVRRAGAFSAPVTLANLEGVPGLAVARGGWTAVAWVARDARAASLTLVVIAPDGRQTRTILERTRSLSLDWPRVAIGPAGDVTVLWSRRDSRARRLRVARLGAGGAPVVSDLPGVLSERDAVAPFALAGAPGGATLLAWATEDGVRAQNGAGEPVLVSPAADVSSLTASLNDAGAAIVAHDNAADELVLVDRAPAGAWALPRVLDEIANDPSVTGVFEHDAIRGSALTADGRAVVVWTEARDGRMSIAAANGRAGGAWSGPAALSAITREGYTPSVSLDAGGEPRVLWTELGTGARGARLGPAALDTTPPVVSARVPTRRRLAASGPFRLSVPVRCSEACDVRLTVRYISVVRALPAGRTTTLRYPASTELARELRRRPRARRVRVRLLVTDRAGNVVRLSRVVRVRVG